jgi:hypothetical protein
VEGGAKLASAAVAGLRAGLNELIEQPETTRASTKARPNIAPLLLIVVPIMR